ncbi:hypothetical protein JI666_01710 [Bacillus sp. NTK071]|uniref:Uncharacterized protein n=1 Tax=Guptibacillus hwajinpoensis TaxID=208199 RepID=A0A4U1MM12_9BACL|nr:MULTISPECIES: hypothetical protein [Bacillaceae]MBN8207460.1 hypothetical protein [Bacillus sp. NTK071]TKD71675.1 hypothetical protein FBF83_02410 [Pseudalkalibacillus hwajinpoensis]
MNDPGHPERNNSFYEEAGEEFGVYTPAAARELTITDHQKREQQEGSSQSKKAGREEQEDGR